mgnify:CR=1 FL=1
MSDDIQQRVTAIGLTPKSESNGMQYRHVGRSGLMASAIGVGCFAFGGYVKQDGVQQVVDQALDLGINYFDTANSYGIGKSEEALGLALQGGKRQQALIATKFGNRTGDGPNETGNSRMATINACEASLRRLGTRLFLDGAVYERGTPKGLAISGAGCAVRQVLPDQAEALLAAAAVDPAGPARAELLAAEAAAMKSMTEASSNLKAAGQVLNLFLDQSIADGTPFSKIRRMAFSISKARAITNTAPTARDPTSAAPSPTSASAANGARISVSPARTSATSRTTRWAASWRT